MVKKAHEINVEFSLIGEDFDVDLVTDLLGITPTEVLIKGEKPENKNIPNIETSWSIATGFEESFDINIQLSKLLNIFSEKQEILKELQKRFNLLMIISVTIYLAEEGFPAIYLEKETINFLSKIEAMIDIDMY